MSSGVHHRAIDATVASPARARSAMAAVIGTERPRARLVALGLAGLAALLLFTTLFVSWAEYSVVVDTTPPYRLEASLDAWGMTVDARHMDGSNLVLEGGEGRTRWASNEAEEDDPPMEAIRLLRVVGPLTIGAVVVAAAAAALLGARRTPWSGAAPVLAALLSALVVVLFLKALGIIGDAIDATDEPVNFVWSAGLFLVVAAVVLQIGAAAVHVVAARAPSQA